MYDANIKTGSVLKGRPSVSVERVEVRDAFVPALDNKKKGRVFDSGWCHFNFSISIILLSALRPWVLLSLYSEMSNRNFPGIKEVTCWGY